jgi:hypothetical protein
MIQMEVHLIKPVMQIIEQMGEKLPLRTAVRLGKAHKELDVWQSEFDKRVQEVLASCLEEGETEIKPDHPKWVDFQNGIQDIVGDEAPDIDIEPFKFDDLEGVDLTPVQARILFEAGLLTD